MGDASLSTERDESVEGPSTGVGTERDLKALLSAGLVSSCHYAERPTDRPHCAGLGVVRYGPITLCEECDRRRSAVGKAMRAVRLPDPAVLLEVLGAERALRQAGTELSQAVSAARRAGQPWSAIGAILGITRQAAQQRFDDGRRDPSVRDR
jgi:hypothetical protein